MIKCSFTVENDLKKGVNEKQDGGEPKEIRLTYNEYQNQPSSEITIIDTFDDSIEMDDCGFEANMIEDYDCEKGSEISIIDGDFYFPDDEIDEVQTELVGVGCESVRVQNANEFETLSEITIIDACDDLEMDDVSFEKPMNEGYVNQNFAMESSNDFGGCSSNISPCVTTTNDSTSNGNVEDSLSANDLKGLLSAKDEVNVTKKGESRKRKIYTFSKLERDGIKRKMKEAKYAVKEPCSHEACNSAISEDRRKELNSQFLNFNFSSKYTFGRSTISRDTCKYRQRNSKELRENTFSFYLTNESGKIVQVCQKFYLTTLGFQPSNDSFIRSAVGKKNYLKPIPQMSGQGKHAKTPKIDRQLIIDHINSFNPTVHHHRRSHAPKRKYLPSDITIQMMYDDFIKKNPKMCSYDLYREVVSGDLKISFAKLGHEECEECERYELHSKTHTDAEKPLEKPCEKCREYEIHKHKYTEARKLYDDHKNLSTDEHQYVSADLQKVIMLPRCDMFKQVIFTPRIIVFNESVVPVGENPAEPVAFLWHEAISGRRNYDIISTFHKYFRIKNLVKYFTIWLDNCAAQNKNWAFYTFLTHIVNSCPVKAITIELYYFEPGHSFMSADYFHHQVEQSLQRKKKVYDFDDFKEAVKNANSKNVNAVEMTLEDFRAWPNLYSYTKLKKTQPRPYMSDIVYVRADRGSNVLKYRTEYSSNAEEFTLDFLQVKYLKSEVSLPPSKTENRGVTTARKEKLLNTLDGLIPDDKLVFWKKLPECANETKLCDE